jgi:hypothetical protein
MDRRSPICVTILSRAWVAIVPRGWRTEDVSLTEVVQARAILSHKGSMPSNKGQLNAGRVELDLMRTRSRSNQP